MLLEYRASQAGKTLNKSHGYSDIFHQFSDNGKRTKWAEKEWVYTIAN